MIDFLILYEIPNRELESDILLIRELEKRGYSAQLQLFPFDSIRKLRKKYRDNINVLIIHSAYDEEVLFNLAYEVFGNVKKIVNLQWEQIRNKQWEDDYSSYLYPKGCAMNVKHVCWGTRISECFRNYGIDEKNIFLTGPMHMDTLRKEYDYLYIPREEIVTKYGLQPDKKIVLIISSFSMVDVEEHTLKDLIYNLGEEFVRYVIKVSSESRKVLLEWLDRACEDRDDCVFIYRPHPEEIKSAEINGLVSKHDNFKVISDLGVKQWIKVSDRIFIWNSTSAGEAYAAGKKFDIVRPADIGEFNNILFEGSKEYIDTYDRFVCGIDSDEGYDTSSVAKYYDITETSAHVRLADKLEEYINDKNDFFGWTKSFLMKSRWWALKRSVAHMMAILANPIDKYLLKMDGAKKQNVITKIFASRKSKLVSRNHRKQRFEIDKEIIFKKFSFDDGV